MLLWNQQWRSKLPLFFRYNQIRVKRSSYRSIRCHVDSIYEYLLCIKFPSIENAEIRMTTVLSMIQSVQGKIDLPTNANEIIILACTFARTKT